MLATEAGTRETPSPAATKLTSVAVSDDLVRGEWLEAVRGAGVLDGVVHDGPEVRRIGHERLALEPLERDLLHVGERVGLRQDGDQRLGAEDLGA